MDFLNTNYILYGKYVIKIDGAANILTELVKGRPKHEIDLYEDAVRSLVKNGFLQEYHS